MGRYGEIIRSIAEEREITLKELSKASGVNLHTIYSYTKSSRIPTLEKAVSIADALECTLDELAGRGCEGEEDK